MDVVIRKVLFTTDLSDASFQALPVALTVAERFESPLVVLCAIESSAYLTGLAARPELVKFLEEARPVAESRIREQLELHPTSVAVEVRIVESVPPVAPEIVRQVQEVGADLIVMATHGRSGLLHVLIGSVTERVVRTSPVPVLTVRVGDEEEPES